MDIKGKTVMILGGYGQVGSAVSRCLLSEEPAHLIVTSLRKEEVQAAVERLMPEAPGPCRLTPMHGNLFVRWSLKDVPPGEIAATRHYQRQVTEDVMGDLTEEVLTSSTLYRLISEHRPEIIIDCLNTATALAYQDVYQCYQDICRSIDPSTGQEEQTASIYRLLGTLCIPPLIRHVQSLYEAMKRAATLFYLKIGTTGTGGMGLNIPVTHGEEHPSRLLLTKAAVAGAHTQLLFLLAMTPGGPVIKELKPAALIGWKGVDRGRIIRAGRAIPLYDCSPDEGYRLASGKMFRWEELHVGRALEGKELEGVYVDTGENGVFSLDEFEVITTLGLMEFVTPEEIANTALLEIQGVNTSRDVLGAMAGAVIGPSYRAGVLRQRAIKNMQTLGNEGIAYGMLGGRVAKLIFEAHVIKRCYATMEDALEQTPEEMSQALEKEVRSDHELRSAAVSIGVPMLLPDGETLLFASRLQRDKAWEGQSWSITAENLDKWAHREWIDLRPGNMVVWQSRFQKILLEAKEGSVDTSSCLNRGADFWPCNERGRMCIDPGEVAGYVLIKEQGGGRFCSDRM